MKKLTFFLPLFFFLFSFFFFNSSHAISYTPQANNKFGIHILDPSEIQKAAELVNSHGGDWGYVTIPIQANDRNLDKWQQFMHQARQLHLIPILRITTIPQGGTWAQAQDTDIVDFANFLNQLDWPTQNRHIIVFNEVNRAAEWGGRVDPVKYARILKNASLIFKERSPHFFILPAGLDNALPNSTSSLSAPNYLKAMQTAIPEIWNYLDGWTSHAYPNPAFSASPYKTGWQSITSYRQELNFIKQDLPVFITETGWDQTKLKPKTLYSYYQTAWQTWLRDDRVVAVTPFVLQAGTSPFAKFSFLDNRSQPTAAWQATFDLPKTAGQPVLASPPSSPQSSATPPLSTASPPFYQSFRLLLSLENLFRRLLGLPPKAILHINHHPLLVEVARTPAHISKGLSFRSHLGENSGMLFLFPQPRQAKFWMKNMRFPLDIIWIKDNTIVDFTRNAQPEGDQPQTLYFPRQPVDKVLEVNAGYIDSHKLKIGDKIDLP